MLQSERVNFVLSQKALFNKARGGLLFGYTGTPSRAIYTVVMHLKLKAYFMVEDIFWFQCSLNASYFQWR